MAHPRYHIFVKIPPSIRPITRGSHLETYETWTTNWENIAKKPITQAGKCIVTVTTWEGFLCVPNKDFCEYPGDYFQENDN